MEFGIFTVGDITTDPTTGRAPTENERIKATTTLLRNLARIAEKKAA